MSLLDWKNFKRSGGYRRRVQKKIKSMVNNSTPSTSGSVPLPVNCETNKEASGSVQNVIILNEEQCSTVSEEISESDSDNDEYIDVELKRADLRERIRNWALQFNIPHSALNALSKEINSTLPYALPLDARTLLRTNEAPINIIEMGAGHYWHNGLIPHLEKILRRLREVPDKIS